MRQLIDMPLEEIVTKLEGFLQKQQELDVLILKFRYGTTEEQRVARESLRRKYAELKQEVDAYYRDFDKFDAIQGSPLQRFFVPAIQDIQAHISNVGVNRISKNGLDIFQSAVYDIGSYASWHLNMMKSV